MIELVQHLRFVERQITAVRATIDVALGIHLHAVGDPGLGAAQIGEHAVALPGERTVGVQVERPDQPAARWVSRGVLCAWE